MRFVCDSCRAQYMISDDKVGPKGVKVRCKKCGHTITVRPAGAAAGKDSPSEPATSSAPASASNGASTPSTPSKEAESSSSSSSSLPATLGTPPEGGLFTDVEEDEIGAVFDQVLSSGTHKIPAGESVGEAAARDATAENVRKLAEAEDEPDKDEAKAPASSHDWYVAIDEKQVGPLSVEKVKDAWDRGEVGPDSLCWRSGFSDWIPLSETAELASVLAPRPSKPTIVAPEPVSGSSPTVQPGPVQSAFSAGKASKGDSAPAPSASSEAPSGWKPSAASVLASLVKEENDAFSKPPPTPAPPLGREPVSQSRLLDVPMPPPEPVSSPSLMGASAAMAAQMAPPQAQQPYPHPQQSMAPYGQPSQMPYGQQPAPYAQPGPAQYSPAGYAPTYAQQGGTSQGGKNRMGLMVGIAVGVLGLGGGVLAFTMKGDSKVEAPATSQVASPPVAAATPPPVAAPVNPPPVAAPVQPPPVVAGAAATPTPPPVAAGTPEANPAVAAGTPAQPAATPPPVATPPAVAQAPVSPTPPVETAKPLDSAVAKVERTTPRKNNGSSAAGRREEPEERPAARAEKPAASEGDSDDFDELFGTKKPKSEPKPSENRPPTAYIPPEPGGGGVRDTLQRSDIMEVVLNNKPAIVKCVNEQKKKDPMLSGKLVMRWTIQTSGKTANVTCKTDEYRTTYMASCISGLIKSWAFPRHKKQGEPIDFPFTF
ncbi:adventurous gliding motility protein GltJ [Myxococcus sp. CA056]|uniref:adventurous gliding motility protein GltJ n=1 Tax=Myxococcus sp. CA056 TaxID=2741740 RepID=UPI00157ACEED|nr:adventurous gliding motility protein GltJ [Myxococcus sp. CA056]NTX15522.1 adventurous gliding motility protein GltJ [Myxococcus sp. CA056]